MRSLSRPGARFTEERGLLEDTAIVTPVQGVHRGIFYRMDFGRRRCYPPLLFLVSLLGFGIQKALLFRSLLHCDLHFGELKYITELLLPTVPFAFLWALNEIHVQYLLCCVFLATQSERLCLPGNC